MYSNYPISSQPMTSYYPEDDRFFLAPFLFGGLAGTALGFGIANNNQVNNQPYYPMIPMYYSYPMMPPTYSTSNNYYYQ